MRRLQLFFSFAFYQQRNCHPTDCICCFSFIVDFVFRASMCWLQLQRLRAIGNRSKRITYVKMHWIKANGIENERKFRVARDDEDDDNVHHIRIRHVRMQVVWLRCVRVCESGKIAPREIHRVKVFDTIFKLILFKLMLTNRPAGDNDKSLSLWCACRCQSPPIYLKKYVYQIHCTSHVHHLESGTSHRLNPPKI